MAFVQNSEFNGIAQPVDGTLFKNTKFRECTLVYSGGDVPGFVDCEFINCKWKFAGAALNTINFIEQRIVSREFGWEQIVATLSAVATAMNDLTKKTP